MLEQAIKNTQETFEITFYKDGSATTPTSVTVDIEKLSGVTVVSGTSVVSSATATAGTPSSYIIPSNKTTSLGQYRVIWKPVIDGETRQETQYFEIVTTRTRYIPNRAILEAIGDMPIPDGIDLSRFCRRAEARIDTALHGKYITPIDLSTSAIAQEAIDLIESIGQDLATGYFLESLSAVQQIKEVNAYAKNLIDRAEADLKRLKEQDMILTGAVADSDKSDDFVRFPTVLVSSPDGQTNAKDTKSYFNRPYDQIAEATYEVDLDI